MSDRNRFEMRLPSAFKKNTQQLIDELFDCGLVDSKDLSSYVRDAIIEKRNKDQDRISSMNVRYVSG